MLLDLKMKEVGGTTLLKRLRREDAPVPFVVVTGQGDEKIAVDLMKQGALDYVMKDSGLLDLLPGVVKRALEATDRDRALAAAQSRLRDSETRFASAVAATLDGVWEVRFPGSDSYFSARFAAILGLKPEELPQTFTSWESRLHPEDRVRFLDSYQAFLDGEGSSFSNEHRLRHQDGTYRWVLARALLVRDAEGKPLRLTGALTDLTERKQLEKEVLRISDREQWRIGQDLHDGLGPAVDGNRVHVPVPALGHRDRPPRPGRPGVADVPVSARRHLPDALARARADAFHAGCHRPASRFVRACPAHAFAGSGGLPVRMPLTCAVQRQRSGRTPLSYRPGSRGQRAETRRRLRNCDLPGRTG
jgi:PAS domain S-box-containing protein